MTVLAEVASPSLRGLPLGRIAPRVQEVGFPLLQPLSVFLGDGVVPRADRADNHNELGSDLGKYQRVEPGDVVFNKLRTWQGGYGVSAHEGIVSPAYIVLRPRPDLVEPHYLHHVLRSAPYLAEFHRISKWMPPSQFDTAWEDIRALPLWLPPIEEQRRIADFLDDQTTRIDNIITARQQQVELAWDAAYAELADRVLRTRSASVPLRRLIANERLGAWGADPTGVGDVLVARVADFNRSLFRLGAVETLRSIPAAQVATRRLAPGDVVLERSGGTDRNPVGCAVYVQDPGSNMVCSNFVSRLRPAEGVGGRYLTSVLAALYATGQQRPHSTQTTGIQNLNTTSYFAVRVPLLSSRESEQLGRRVFGLLDETHGMVAGLDNALSLLQEFKRSLITEAVSGEFEVSSASGRGVPA